jgi:hypothetical protein
VPKPIHLRNGKHRESTLRRRDLPATRMMATRYGRGRAKLKASSCGSTAGSPSISFNHAVGHGLSCEKSRFPLSHCMDSIDDSDQGYR